MTFQEFCNDAKTIDEQLVSAKNSYLIKFKKPGGTEFSIDPDDIINFLKFLSNNHASCKKAIESNPLYTASSYIEYQEKPYRALYKKTESDSKLNTIRSLGGSQTNELTKIISKFICFFSGQKYENTKSNTYFDKQSIDRAIDNIPQDLTTLGSKKITNANNLKESFKEWLRKNGLSEKTIYSYSETSINKVDKILCNFPEFNVQIYNIKLPNKLQNIIIALEKVPEWTEANLKGSGMYQTALNKYAEFLASLDSITTTYKPFLLLAGISGTGKTRFVREQAQRSGSLKQTYCLVSVRPDWHEPSDLLGYISRLRSGGSEYVVTDVLKFIVKAWLEVIDDIDTADNRVQPKPFAEIRPYWLCLDEMNLAPVEQYFADYLSVLETRCWEDVNYSCDALLKPETLKQVEAANLDSLRRQLGLDDSPLHQRIWQYFLNNGIPIPFNLIVAGTVNMDETTHGFSRKVIDRALTFDFGEFFPNDFDQYFDPQSQPKILGYPLRTNGRDLQALANAGADPDGLKSVAFISAVNTVLKGSSFELAYRSLNELLLAVSCFSPADDAGLQAVWDDFLMCKVLPRIEGDADKLAQQHRTPDSDTGLTLLDQLSELLSKQLGEIWEGQRDDLMREAISGSSAIQVSCRSKHKLLWMTQRLESATFTSFWP